jgi:hypothetical protein
MKQMRGFVTEAMWPAPQPPFPAAAYFTLARLASHQIERSLRLLRRIDHTDDQPLIRESMDRFQPEPQI